MAGNPSVRLSVAFAIIPEWIILNCSANAVKLYAILHRHADGERKAWPGRRRLAELLDVSVNTLDRVLTELKKNGAITVQPRIDGSGQHSNVYILEIDRPLPTDGEPPHPWGQPLPTDGEGPSPLVTPRTIVSERDKGLLRKMGTKPSSLALPPTPEEAERIARERWPERFA